MKKNLEVDVFAGKVEETDVWVVRISRKPKSYCFEVNQDLISAALLRGIVENTLKSTPPTV